MKVSEVAERSGVSPQAVREYCRTHFDESKKSRSGWIINDDEVREIIAYYARGRTYRNDAEEERCESKRKKRKESDESTQSEQVSELIAELRNQLSVKDAQIEVLSESLRAAHESLHAAQALHGADVMPKAIEAAGGAPDAQGAARTPEPPTRWQYFKAVFTGRIGMPNDENPAV